MCERKEKGGKKCALIVVLLCSSIVEVVRRTLSRIV
jgi:hypothetical protein